MINKKLEMHAIIDSIENDFIDFLKSVINIEDINCEIFDKSNDRNDDKNDLNSILNKLDIGDYIQIINENIGKIPLKKSEKDFMNKDFSKIIPIRNRVMHPRPLEFNDYAILTNTFYNLPSSIKSFPWSNVNKLLDIFKNHPDDLFTIVLSKYDKNGKILENLPTPDFDDTTYIGREKEIAEIKKLIIDKRFKILSIIGEGGVGKTATTVKVLYDLLEEEKFDYEAIIWSTLKTQQLDKISFTQIKDCISSFADLSSKITQFIPCDSTLSPEENIIEFAKNFKTLLVLDNLETINTKDIKDFVLNFSQYGQIIITSRIGLGELEYRYQLDSLNANESFRFMKILLEYYGLNSFFTDDEIRNIAVNELYSNPLTIKWFTRSLYYDNDVKKLLQNKDDVINFCMNNVYEKLSELSMTILSLLAIENRSLTYAEIVFLLGIDLKDEINIRKAINELSKSNFLDDAYGLDGNITLTKISNEYIRISHYPDVSFINSIIERRKQLSIIKQNMEIKNELDMFNPKSIMSLDKPDKIIASSFLLEALGFSAKGNWQDAFTQVELAKKVSPNFFETYKISAFLYAQKKDSKAFQEYQEALKLCESNEEKVIIQVLLSNYCLEQQDDRKMALQYIEEALNYNQHPYIYLLKVKVLTYLAKYDLALETIDLVTFDELNSLKYKNLYLTRKADIYLRKSQIDIKRDYRSNYDLIKQCIEILEESPKGDFKLYNLYARALNSLSYYHSDEEIMEYLFKKIKDNYHNIFSTQQFRSLARSLSKNFEIIKFKSKGDYLHYIFDYKNYIDDFTNNNIGIIACLFNNYGFIFNSFYKDGLYFSISASDRNYELGDIVKYDIYTGEKGDSAINVQKTGTVINEAKIKV
ncbi:MAG: NB-ARC domain-containing protein [Clostridia bacterium]|nr:NB-ARC domain-containing protein [Clostridia bacterium]